MAEHVVTLDLEVKWNPNAPEAILLSNGFGTTLLALNPHHDDPDQRCVVLVWAGTCSAVLAPPNDEAISGHRLYDRGLDKVLWVGEIRDSEAIRALEVQNRWHPFHDPAHFEVLAHHIVLLKECVVEVIAEAVSVQRLEGCTPDAAIAAMRA